MLSENKLKSKNCLFAVMMTYLLSSFLVNDLGIRYIYCYAVLGVILLAIAIKSKFQVYLSSVKVLYVFIVAVSAVLAILPNSNFGHLVFSLTISMLIFAAYFIFMAPGEKTIIKALTVLHAVSIFFSLYLFFVKIFPDAYWRFVHPLLGEYSSEIASRFIPQGYGVPIGGSTTYAAYVIFIALVANAAYLFKKDFPTVTKHRIFIIASSMLYFAAIMLTNRRSETLGSIAALGILFVLSLNLKKKKDARKKFIIMFVAVILMVAIVVSLAFCGFLSRYNDLLGFLGISTDIQDLPLDEKPLEPDISADELSGGRIALWGKALSLFASKPIFGIGWEQFMTHNPNEYDVHNTYLQWLCETGIVGFVLLFVPLMAILLLTLKQSFRLMKSENSSSTARVLNYISLGMQLYFLIVNLIDPAFYHLNFFCFFSLAMILTETATKLETFDTGVEQDCLRTRLLPKLSKLKIFY